MSTQRADLAVRDIETARTGLALTSAIENRGSALGQTLSLIGGLAYSPQVLTHLENLATSLQRKEGEMTQIITENTDRENEIINQINSLNTSIAGTTNPQARASLQSQVSGLVNEQTKCTNNRTNAQTAHGLIASRLTIVQNIITAMQSFVGGDSCQNELTATTYNTKDELTQIGTTAEGYALRNEKGEIMSPVTVGGNDYYIVNLQGVSRLVRVADITIDNGTGVVHVANPLQFYDGGGNLLAPQPTTYVFSLYPSANINVSTIGVPAFGPQAYVTTPGVAVNASNYCTVYTMKKLTIRRQPTQSLQNNTKTILGTHLAPVMANYPLTSPNSLVRQILDPIINTHPDFAGLPEYTKDAIRTDLWTNNDPAGRHPNAGMPYANCLGDINTRNRHTTPPAPNPTIDMLETRINSPDISPQPSSADLANPVAFHNWIITNYRVLIENRIRRYWSQEFQHIDVATAIAARVNEQIHTYQTNFTNNTNLAPHRANDIATALPHQARPHESALSRFLGRANNHLRLFRGSSTTIPCEYGTPAIKASVDLFFPRANRADATITLPDDTKVRVVGGNVGELIRKICTDHTIRHGNATESGQLRTMLALSTIKAFVQIAHDHNMELRYRPNPNTMNQTSLSIQNGHLVLTNHVYDTTTNLYTDTVAFSEDSPERLSQTNGFVRQVGEQLTTMLNQQYTDYDNRMRSMTRKMTFDSQKSGILAAPRRWIRKMLNRNDHTVEGFSFSVSKGKLSADVQYEPNGMITITYGDGTVKKGKNLGKLLNKRKRTYLRGAIQRGDRVADGLETQIMNGFYENLSREYMTNSRVERYHYIVNDPSQNRQIVILPGTTAGGFDVGVIERRSDLVDLIGNTGARVGSPPGGVRILTDRERASITQNPAIMTPLVKQMDKSMEQLLRLGRISVTVATVRNAILGTLGLAAAPGALVGGSAGLTAGLKTGGLIGGVTGGAAGAVVGGTKTAAMAIGTAGIMTGQAIIAAAKAAQAGIGAARAGANAGVGAGM